MLWRSRVELRAGGVLYPGEASWLEQVEAVRDAIGVGGPERRPVQVGAWHELTQQLLGWSGPVAIVSMELLSFAGRSKVGEIVESLRPAEVHAVITARDLARVIPSAWQESTQNRQTWTWPDYLASLTGDGTQEPTAYRRFWKHHDLAVIADHWAAATSSGVGSRQPSGWTPTATSSRTPSGAIPRSARRPPSSSGGSTRDSSTSIQRRMSGW
jgi:hypothetical protein